MKHQYLYLFGCSHGIFLSVCLWIRRGMAGRFLAVLGLVISFELFVEYRFAVSGFSTNLTLFHVREAFGFLYGPLVFYYVSAITDSFSGFRMRSLCHLILPVIYGILELTVMRGNLSNFSAVWAVQNVFCHVKSLVIFMYISFALAELIKYRRRIGEYFSNTEHIGFRWLLLFIPSVLAIVVMGEAGVILREFGNRYCQTIINIHFVFIALAVYGVSYMTFILPDAYSHIHRMCEMNQDVCNDTDAEKKKYEKSLISDSDRELHLSELLRLLERDELFLDPDLTIGQVAGKMNISVNTLSQVINSMTGKNFFRFINDYRVAYAERHLTGGGFEVNILSLAYKSGFNSKSAFYNAFKTRNGVTPLEYMNSRTQSNSRVT